MTINALNSQAPSPTILSSKPKMSGSNVASNWRSDDEADNFVIDETGRIAELSDRSEQPIERNILNNQDMNSYTTLSSLPSFGSPVEESEYPIAASTPNKLFTSRFNSSPLGLGLNTHSTSATQFRFTNSGFFTSLQSLDRASEKSSSLYATSGLKSAFQSTSFQKPSSLDDEPEDEDITTSSEIARRDAERLEKLTSGIQPTLRSPKASLPSFLQSRNQSKIKTSPLTSPSQSPTPVDRSGSSSAQGSFSLQGVRGLSPTPSNKSNEQSPSPVRRYFIPPLQPMQSDEGENLEAESGKYHSSQTDDSSETSDLPPRNTAATNSTSKHDVNQLNTQNTSKTDNSQSSRPTTPQTSPSRAKPVVSHRLSPKPNGKSPLSMRVLRDLSRCMSSPSSLISDRSHQGSPDPMGGSKSPKSRMNVQTTKDFEAKRTSAGKILNNLELLNMEMQQTQQEFDTLEKKLGAMSEGDHDVEPSTAEPVLDNSDMQADDDIDLNKILMVNPERHALFQFVIQLYKLILVCLFLVLALNGLLSFLDRQSLFRPYIGPEIALGRRGTFM
ncbi:hypothetical protein V1512DRAFT_265852 [Lipomyces arxii]|uniref:uncharacterized protein n=1 Tax=Lipomyces arxii TaxID=56418 RepID=UPI0034CF3775